MKPTTKPRPIFWVITAVLAVFALLAVMVLSKIPKEQYVSDSNINLSALDDGVYQGECDNGLVFAKVEVEVREHTITDIRILEHRNGMGQAAEEITDSVTSNQSVEVDAVSGATFSSQTILKAIENAIASK